MSEEGKGGTEIDVLVVGAGFAGIYLAYRLRKLGIPCLVLERGDGVGGTWYWNRYPGARCDIESMEYSYQFSDELQQQWEWSERYAPQPEILGYANHVADRFDLRRDMRFGVEVTAARWNDATARWTVTTDAADPALASISARWVVLATGCLSSTNLPAIDGLKSFAGATYHTGRWPHDGVDFTGLRVGIVGTGSSAVQSIPIIAEQAGHLTVFQRTPNYVVPARNAPMDPDFMADFKARYAELRARAKANRTGNLYVINPTPAFEVSAEERRAEYQRRWDKGGLGYVGSFGDLILNRAANETAGEFIREKIRAIVKDPETAALLCPDTMVGCKRLCLDTGYFETFNRPNVSLVDVKSQPIERISPAGIVTGGREYPLDAIVFATGFDAMTGALTRIDIRGRDGLSLAEKWSAGPRTYLGLATAGFPNLFTVTGPGSPSVLSNMLPSIEQHVEWISDCVDHLRREGLARIEATPRAEDDWVAHVNAVAGATLFPTCNSWYLGANVPGKPRVFMPYLGFPQYVAKCDEVRARGYEGFELAA